MSEKQGREIPLSQILFILIFAVTIIVFSVINVKYISLVNISNIFKQMSIVAISGLGLTFVVAISKTDVSFYLNACFASCLACWLVEQHGGGLLTGTLLGLAAGVMWGFASGALAGLLNLPDIIITIAVGCISYGFAYVFSNGQLIYVSGTEFAVLNDGFVGPVAVPTLIMIILFVFGFILLERTNLGVRIYAIGINKTSAWFSGINVKGITVMAFIICSALTALAGMINATSKGSATVDIAANLLLPVYTAVFVGVAIFKRPCVIGTFLGALLIQMLSNGFTLLNQPYYVGDMVTAWLLVGALLISVLRVQVKTGRKGKSEAVQKGGAQ